MKDNDKILWGTEPHDEVGVDFVEALYVQLDAIFHLLGVHDYAVQMVEYDRTNHQVSWSADLLFGAIALSEPAVLSDVKAAQQYFAKNSACSAEDYEGCITIKMRYPSELPLRKGRVLLYLAFASYYDSICDYYPQWTTYYKDLPIICS